MKKQAKSLPDTNTIIRYLMGDDAALFGKAKSFFDEVKSGNVKAVILESVIAECIYVLTRIYKVPRHKAAGSIIDILRYKGIANSDREELINALTLFSDNKLDIVDCILAAKTMAGGDTLFSFDNELNNLTRRA